MTVLLKPIKHRKHMSKDISFISEETFAKQRALHGNAVFALPEEEAKALIEALPVPSRKTETWKYTRFEQGMKEGEKYGVGRWNATLSTQEGIQSEEGTSMPLGDTLLGEQDFYLNLNRALLTNTLHITITETREEPLHIVVRAEEAGMIFPRIRLTVKKGVHARGTIAIETVEGAVVVAVQEIYIEEGGEYTQIVERRGKEKEWSQLYTGVYVEGKGAYYGTVLQRGGEKMRTSFCVTIGGEGAKTELYGITHTGEKTEADIHVEVRHLAPHTESTQSFKGVYDGASREIFDGKIYVKEGAQKVHAQQNYKGMLVTKEAESYAKPQLEVYADDVQCAHGAAIGHLDEEALFYLRSRGIEEKEAKHMLEQAFLEEVIQKGVPLCFQEHAYTVLDLHRS
jgi:Fe-S cluster assembly scaffold protein SufB